MMGFFQRESPAEIFPRNPQADAALKRATELKNENINQAIEQLRGFQIHAASGQVIYPVECFLRLPLYLQTAGRRDEAWEEFYQLLKNGCPNEPADLDIRLISKSTIYDKMRLFLQRDKNHLLAVHFGVLSYASWLAALFHQSGRRDELIKAQSPENMRSVFEKLLSKAGRPEWNESLVSAMRQFIQLGYLMEFIEKESRKICGIVS